MARPSIKVLPALTAAGQPFKGAPAHLVPLFRPPLRFVNGTSRPPRLDHESEACECAVGTSLCNADFLKPCSVRYQWSTAQVGTHLATSAVAVATAATVAEAEVEAETEAVAAVTEAEPPVSLLATI